MSFCPDSAQSGISMRASRKFLVIFATAALAAITCWSPAIAAVKKDAHVTQIIREVNVLASKSKARAAAVNDLVSEGEAVRTGDNSRSELTFADLTISRLGANSIFTFNKAGRDVQLSSGSVLLRVPKDSGGAGIHTSAVSVAVTGTTVILENARGGHSKLIVLEGGARLSLVKYSKQSQYAHAAQMIDVPPGATTVPAPVDIDLNDLMRHHPLLTDFPPLPSQPLIAAAAQQQGPIYQGRPVSGPARIFPPLIGLNPPQRQPRSPGYPGQQAPPPQPPGKGGGRGTGSAPITGGGATTTTPTSPTAPTTGNQPPPGRHLPPQTGNVARQRQPPAAHTTATPPQLPSIGRAIGGPASSSGQTGSRPRKRPTPPPIR